MRFISRGILPSAEGTLAIFPQMREINVTIDQSKRAIFARECLHWLRVSERIDYKIAVLTYRVLHGDAPLYLGPLTSVVDLPSRRALRSAVTNRLVVPSVRLSTVSSRAFPAAAPRIWNSLPEHVVTAATLQSFKKHLKTFLLQRSYSLAL